MDFGKVLGSVGSALSSAGPAVVGGVAAAGAAVGAGAVVVAQNGDNIRKGVQHNSKCAAWHVENFFSGGKKAKKAKEKKKAQEAAQATSQNGGDQQADGATA